MPLKEVSERETRGRNLGRGWGDGVGRRKRGGKERGVTQKAFIAFYLEKQESSAPFIVGNKNYEIPHL